MTGRQEALSVRVAQALRLDLEDAEDFIARAVDRAVDNQRSAMRRAALATLQSETSTDAYEPDTQLIREAADTLDYLRATEPKETPS